MTPPNQKSLIHLIKVEGSLPLCAIILVTDLIMNYLVWFIQAGIEGLCSWGWESLQQLPRAGRGTCLGLLPFQSPRIQQSGVLGPTQRCSSWWTRLDERAVQLGPSASMPSGLHMLLPSKEFDPMATGLWRGDQGTPTQFTTAVMIGWYLFHLLYLSRSEDCCCGTSYSDYSHVNSLSFSCNSTHIMLLKYVGVRSNIPNMFHEYKRYFKF